MPGPRAHRRCAFTLIELLVAIAIIGILLAIALPAMERVRHMGYIAACASNLHQLGLAIAAYANENHGQLPRTTYVPGAPLIAGTGTTSTDFFSATGPKPNDVTAPFWLLARTQRLPTSLFICPYNDVNEFQADTAPVSAQANFTDFKKNLGYSYDNPYPDAATATANGPRARILAADHVLMADLNPGVSDARHADAFKPTPTSSRRDVAYGNSGNHEREGQNVLFGDGHVSYETSCLVGVHRDNIYTSQSATKPTINASPASAEDSVLLPTD